MGSTRVLLESVIYEHVEYFFKELDGECVYATSHALMTRRGDGLQLHVSGTETLVGLQLSLHDRIRYGF